MLENTATHNARIKRNRIYMIVVFIAIVVVTSTLFFAIRVIGAQRAVAHKHSFYQYIVTHHIGTLQEIDDGTGLDPLSYVLTLNHPVPEHQLQSYATDLMHKYVLYDSGSTLTIEYKALGQTKPTQLAQANFDDDAGALILTLHPQSNNSRQIVQHVNW